MAAKAKATSASPKQNKRASGLPKPARKATENGLSIEYVPIGQLQPYERNPRQHSPEQIDAIAASITEFGWSSPIVVDGGYGIVAGHGRHMAAQALGMTTVPVVQLSHLSEAQKRALVIAENQLALSASWNTELLSGEMMQLKADGFDLGLLGFDEIELFDVMNEKQAPGEPSEDVELDAADTKSLMSAWRLLIRDWLDLLERHVERGFIHSGITKGAMAVHFLRARFFGKEIPRSATLAYTPHRALTNGDIIPLQEMFREALTKDQILKSVRFICDEQPKIDGFLGSTLGIHSSRVPGEFPAALARSLIDEFVTTKGGSVLDPCHGWGGRLLGFLLSRDARRYVGFDTDPQTVAGVRLMFNELKQYADGKREFENVNVPFEDAQITEQFDFAVTSPPYFNTEKYGGEKSSWQRYKTYDEWVDGFYAPMITKVAGALKSGAVFALQIGNQRYPLEDSARKIASTCEMSFVELRGTDMTNAYTGTERKDGEIIMILRKDGEVKRKQNVAARFGRVM